MHRTLIDSGAIRLCTDFFPAHAALYEHLAGSIAWDTRIKARKSASFGRPYNYSGIEWPVAPFPQAVAALLAPITAEIGFEPNNCLVNFYPDGNSSMGFHSDSIVDLEPNTGIAVLSLGAERVITFHQIDNKAVRESYPLSPGTLLWMCPQMQADWRHAILADTGVAGGRISLTFRRVKV
ncbi:alpha-ketoglutarate-dependent dioxygenase AlkB [Gemmata sp. JC717]|uniref:alpha-ketoglutarate-dependent dioxygenase AlkB n=1 Tax=Gemmata algarum TaxID=2975278 RepID=UPI0021BB208C|nr:alpha-ketoglutarate-dependent dioxygenase AlkB [Gemmata algarum]MDY3553611.1 alpha-ketoglutarate-dependent dioxygenase AlkB [Gemmata algarum]